MTPGDALIDAIADAVAKQVADKVIAQVRAEFGGAAKVLFQMAEAAERMSISRSTLKDMVHKKEIAVVRRTATGPVLIHIKDMDQWISDNRT